MNSNRHAIRKANKIISMAKGVSPLQLQNVSLTDDAKDLSNKITTPFVKVMGFLTPSPTSKLIIERKLDEVSLIPDEISLVPDEISLSPGQTNNISNNETTRSRNILTPAKIDKTTATTTTTTTSVNNATSGLEIFNESPDHKKPLQFTLKQEIEDLEKFTRSNYAHKEYLERTDILDIINNATHVNDSKSKKEIDNDVTDIKKTCNGSTTTTTTMAIEVITDKDHKATITTPPKCLSPLPTLSSTTAPSQTKTTTQKEKCKLSTYTLKQIEATTHHSSQITGPAKDLITKDLIYNPPKKYRTESQNGTSINITNPTKVHQLTFNQEIDDLMELMGSNYAFNEYLEGMDLLDIIDNATNTNDSNSNKKDSDNDKTNEDYNSIFSTPPKCTLPLSQSFPTTTSPPETTCLPLANIKLSTNNSNPTKATTYHSSQLPGPSKDLILKDLIYDSPKKRGTENDSSTDTQMLEPTVNKKLTKVKVTSNPSTTTNKGKTPLNDTFKAKRYKQVGVEAPKTNDNQHESQGKPKFNDETLKHLQQQQQYEKQIPQKITEEKKVNPRQGDHPNNINQKKTTNTTKKNHYHSKDHTIFINSSSSKLFNISSRSIANTLSKAHNGKYQIVRPKTNYIIVKCSTMVQGAKFMELEKIGEVNIQVTRHQSLGKDSSKVNTANASIPKGTEQKSKPEAISYSQNKKIEEGIMVNQEQKAPNNSTGIRKIIKLHTKYNYLTNKEITDELKYQGAMISKAYRMKSNHEHTSNKILLEFTEKAPLLVQFDGYIQIIMDYKNQVRFCSKCKAWGHYTRNCKNKMRCENCGGSHNDNCTFIGLKCANCRGPHNPKYKECSYYIKEKETIKLMDEQHLSYHEAKQQTLTNRSKTNKNQHLIKTEPT
ncbi:hypothetical protein ACJMK2_013178 [Sinanodonta woodiana]|uniref:CCHC-type domain-containing protein n=1 Tax=Sinanodonta woodiana TaxID=1069815 RepID=A0ABD3UWP8_SINWO